MKKIIEELIHCDEDARKKIASVEEQCRFQMTEIDHKIKVFRDEQEKAVAMKLASLKQKSKEEEDEHVQKLQRNADVEIGLLREKFEKRKNEIVDKVFKIILPRVN